MELSELLSVMTAQMVNTQQILDDAYKAELDTFTVLASTQEDQLHGILGQLAPQRMVIRSFNMSLALSIATERDAEFRIKVFPLNMNYSLRHSMKQESQSRWEMCAEQVPLIQINGA